MRPDLESQVLDRLVLAPPVTFDISLDPAVEPYGSPWRIELAQRTDSSEPPASQISGTASPEGLWRVPGVAAGTYELLVTGDQKAVWHREFLDIKPGQPALRIELPVLRVEGRVSIGKEPLAAALWLSRKGGRRLRFDSDDRGRFSGSLPDEGLWVPQIQATAEKLRATLEPVEIKPPKGKHLATVEIRVPDTRLAGQVVDETGQPVAAAKIIARHLEKNWTDQFEADEKGEFSIRGLHPGPLTVKAEDGERQSDFTPADLPQEGESPWLRLVVRKLQTFDGRVVSPTGGVPGAMILAWSAFNGQGAANMTQVVSDVEGSFHLDLPRGDVVPESGRVSAGPCHASVAAPASPGQPIEIPVESQGGTLTLELTEGWSLTPARPWRQLRRARDAEDLGADPGGAASKPGAAGRLVLPNVEAGPYSLCAGAAAVSRLEARGEPPAASCTGGVLAPNGELVLRAPASLAEK